jgi:hypothetical protein
MKSVSKEFRHNPFLSLLPDEGSFRELSTLAPYARDRIQEIESELSSGTIDDEKQSRLLTAERDMLMVMREWMGITEI